MEIKIFNISNVNKLNRVLNNKIAVTKILISTIYFNLSTYPQFEFLLYVGDQPIFLYSYMI
jgi:hypothetical protein